MELTGKETQEIENTRKDVHTERGFPEIVPSEKWASVLRGIKSPPESLGGTSVSKCQPGVVQGSLPSSRSRA